MWRGRPRSAVRLSERIKQNTAESVFRIWEGSVAGEWRLNGLVALSLDWRKCRESNGGRDWGSSPAWARVRGIWCLFWLPIKITVAVICGDLNMHR